MVKAQSRAAKARVHVRLKSPNTQVLNDRRFILQAFCDLQLFIIDISKYTQNLFQKTPNDLFLWHTIQKNAFRNIRYYQYPLAQVLTEHLFFFKFKGRNESDETWMCV